MFDLSGTPLASSEQPAATHDRETSFFSSPET